tara:strand:- start:1031 stop:1243 length:213 start_codon:yes stop_codon:yes gene_type:complete
MHSKEAGGSDISQSSSIFLLPLLVPFSHQQYHILLELDHDQLRPRFLFQNNFYTVKTSSSIGYTSSSSSP